MISADTARQMWIEHRMSCDKCANADKDAYISAIQRICWQGWTILTKS